jgi:hypothetical protein
MYIGAICSFKNMLINDSNNVIKNAFKKSKIDHSLVPDKRSVVGKSLPVCRWILPDRQLPRQMAEWLRVVGKIWQNHGALAGRTESTVQFLCNFFWHLGTLFPFFFEN